MIQSDLDGGSETFRLDGRWQSNGPSIFEGSLPQTTSTQRSCSIMSEGEGLRRSSAGVIKMDAFASVKTDGLESMLRRGHGKAEKK